MRIKVTPENAVMILASAPEYAVIEFGPGRYYAVSQFLKDGQRWISHGAILRSPQFPPRDNTGLEGFEIEG